MDKKTNYDGKKIRNKNSKKKLFEGETTKAGLDPGEWRKGVGIMLSASPTKSLDVFKLRRGHGLCVSDENKDLLTVFTTDRRGCDRNHRRWIRL